MTSFPLPRPRPMRTIERCAVFIGNPSVAASNCFTQLLRPLAYGSDFSLELECSDPVDLEGLAMADLIHFRDDDHLTAEDEGSGSESSAPTAVTSHFQGEQPNLSGSNLLLNVNQLLQIIDSPLKYECSRDAMVRLDDVVIRLESMETHRVRTDRNNGDAFEISNLRAFMLTISVRRQNGTPYGPCRICIRLVTEDDYPVGPLLPEEDRRFPLIVRPDLAPTEAPPIDVPANGEVSVRLQLGQRALSSRIHDRRFKLLVCLDVPTETLRFNPNLTVFSPPFKGITRLRPTASERRSAPMQSQLGKRNADDALQRLQNRVDALEAMLVKRTMALEECVVDMSNRLKVFEALAREHLLVRSRPASA